MATIKLTYFDFSGARGEECRLALTLAGLPFEDERVKDWPGDHKAKTPFGALPVLSYEGRTLAQSNTILTFVGRKHGLHPKDDWQAAQQESIMGAIEDLRGRLGPIARIKDEAEKKKAREEFAAGYLKEWAQNVEKLVAGPFVGGDKLNVVDLKVFVVLTPFLKGQIDHISADYFKDHPKLVGVHDAVAKHPKVVEWYAKK